MTVPSESRAQFHSVLARIAEILVKVRDKSPFGTRDDFATEIAFLLASLQSIHIEIRMAGSEALAQLPGPLDSEPFIQAIRKESDPYVRASLVTNLKNCAMETAVPFLRELLADRDARIRANAIEILHRFSIPDLAVLAKPMLADTNNRALINAALAYYSFDPPFVLEFFNKLLKGQDEKLKDSVVFGLRSIGTENAIRIIIQTLEEKDCPEHMQIACISGLGILGVKKVLPRLKRFTQVENVNVLITAVDALLKIGDPAAAEFIEPLLLHKNEWVQMAAAQALKGLTGKDFISQLKDIQIFSFIRNSHYFKDFSEKELKELAGKFIRKRCAIGELVYQAGDNSDFFWLQKSGSVVLLGNMGRNDERVISRVKNGECFGDYDLITKNQYTFTSRAEIDSEVLALPREEFFRLIEKKPSILTAIYITLAQKVATANRYIAQKKSRRALVAMLSSQPGLPNQRIGENLVELFEEESHRKSIVLHDFNMKSNSKELMIPIDEKLKVLLPHIKSFCPYENNHLFVHKIHLSRFIGIIAEFYDYILLNLSPNLSPINELALNFASHIFYLTDPTAAQGHREEEFLHYLVENIPNFEPRCQFLFVNYQSRHSPLIAELEKTKKRKFALILPPEEAGDNREKYLRRLRSFARALVQMRVGVALSCGTAYGFAHLGVLMAMVDHKIPIDIISGASMGSLIGAYFCLGFSGEELRRRAAAFTSEKFKQLRDFNYGLFFWNKSGLIKGQKIEQFLAEDFGRKKFADTKIEFMVAASDLNTGEQVIFDSGFLHRAVALSIAIPVIFTVRPFQGRVITDGGVSEPVPVTPLRKRGCDIIISSNVVTGSMFSQFPPEEVFKKSNILNVFLSTFDIMKQHLASKSQFSGDLEIKPDCTRFSWYDFDANRHFIDIGYAAAEKAMPDLKKLIYQENR